MGSHVAANIETAEVVAFGEWAIRHTVRRAHEKVSLHRGSGYREWSNVVVARGLSENR